MRVIWLDPQQASIAVQQAVEGSKRTIQQVREVADPRLIAAGLVGLTAGEIAGGAVGGLMGVVVAGPVGAAVGAQVGAFTVSMVGLKLGTEAVEYHLRAKRNGPDMKNDGPLQVKIGQFLRIKSGERLGEFAGLVSGAAVGIVVAGPIGGLVCATIGEAVGGQLGEDASRSKPIADRSQGSGSPASITRWIDNLGRTTAGEGAVVLAGGTVGSLFGPSGRALGQRLGIIVGKRVRWQRSTPSGDGTHSDGETLDPRHNQGPANEALPASRSGEPAGEIPLTNRQIEVLALYSMGLTPDEIAAELSVRPATVKHHLRTICTKLGIQNIQEASDVTVMLMPVSSTNSTL